MTVHRWTPDLTRFAHSDSKASVACSPDGKYIYTAGADLIMCTFDANALNDIPISEEQNFHHGAITCLAASKYHVATGSTDHTVILHNATPDDMTASQGTRKLLLRSTMPIRALSFNLDGKLLAAAGEDLRIVLLQVDDPDAMHKICNGHSQPVISVDFDPLGKYLASLDQGGHLYVWDISAPAGPTIVTHKASFGGSSRESDDRKCSIAWSPDGSYIAVPSNNELRLVERENWNQLNTLQGHTQSITAVCWSLEQDFLISTAQDGQLFLWNFMTGSAIKHLKHALPIVSAAVLPQGNSVVFMDSDGSISSAAIEFSRDERTLMSALPGIITTTMGGATTKHANDAQSHSEKSASNNDASLNHGASALSSTLFSSPIKAAPSSHKGTSHSVPAPSSSTRTKKSSAPLLDDSDGEELKDQAEQHDEAPEEDYSMFEEEDNLENNGRTAGESAIVRKEAAAPVFCHPIIQPNSTIWRRRSRFLAWNLIGSIVCHKDQSINNNIDIEFHDKRAHRPVRFVDDYGFTMASLSGNGAIFACPSLGQVPSTLNFVSFDSSRQPWTVHLDEGEDVTAVAIGANMIYAMTSRKWLRIFSLNALQTLVLVVPEPICMIAHENQLVIFAEETGNVWSHVYDMSTKKLVARSLVFTAASPTKQLAWAGFSEHGMLGCFDSAGVLYIQPASCDHHWMPALDCGKNAAAAAAASHGSAVGEGKNSIAACIWPIFFSSEELTGVVCHDGETFPDPFPTPLISTIPLQLPLLGLSEPVVVLQEAVMRRHLFSTMSNGDTGLTDKERKRLNTANDKRILELIQLALKADRHARALELCEYFCAEKSLDLAIQLARHNRLLQLADRMALIKDARFALPEEPKESAGQHATALNEWKTPKLPSRIAAESPGTILANLTPYKFENMHGEDMMVDPATNVTINIGEGNDGPVDDAGDDYDDDGTGVSSKRVHPHSPTSRSDRTGKHAAASEGHAASALLSRPINPFSAAANARPSKKSSSDSSADVMDYIGAMMQLHGNKSASNSTAEAAKPSSVSAALPSANTAAGQHRATKKRSDEEALAAVSNKSSKRQTSIVFGKKTTTISVTEQSENITASYSNSSTFVETEAVDEE